MVTAEQIGKIQSEIILHREVERNAKKKVEIILDKIERFAKEYPEKHSINFCYDNDCHLLDNILVVNELKNLGFNVDFKTTEERNGSGYYTKYNKIISW